MRICVERDRAIRTGRPGATSIRTACRAAWARTLFVLIVVLAWPCVVLAPRLEWARSVARHGARFWILGARISVRVFGRERLERVRRPCVVVANHSSKLDAIVLSAVLPFSVGFVAKSELQRAAWLRWPLRRLGVFFVRRDGVPHGVSQTLQATARLRAGESLVWFPEGTFRGDIGLLPFHRGAFVAAESAGVPVVPIAVRGMRGSFSHFRTLFAREGIRVHVGPPLQPPRSSHDARLLAERARSFVAQHCGEPDVTL